jgi:hypothetical protein
MHRFRFCDFLEQQGNLAAALEVHGASARLCNSAVAWVHYLSFCRRAVSISSFRCKAHRSTLLQRIMTPRSRAAFIACKRSGCCTAHVWAFAANLEWRINRCYDIARQLFDVGMKQFSNDMDFVLECASSAANKTQFPINSPLQVLAIFRLHGLRRRRPHSV